MSQYPRDEFDDVPENSERRGAYRGKEYNPNASNKGFIATIVAGCLALLVGAVMFIYQPRTLAPEAASSSTTSASPSASPSEESSTDSTQPGIEIYNGGAYAGAAAEVEQSLTEQGYTVTGTANWQGSQLVTSVVYYSSGYEDTANTLADALGIGLIEEDSQAEADLYVVLGPDFAGVSSSASGTEGAESGIETGGDAGYTDPSQEQYTQEGYVGG